MSSTVEKLIRRTMFLRQPKICLILSVASLLMCSEGSRSTRKDIHGSRLTRHIEKVLRKHSYELSLRPVNKEKPTRVGVSLMIESLTDISEKNMDLTSTLCIHQTWKDPRLRFGAFETNSSIVLPSRLADKIWVPDLYIVGSKSSFVHKTTVNNLVMRLFSDGTIFYSVKITSTVACQMNLHNFPLDVENCSLRIQSLGYKSDEMTLEWSVGSHFEDLFMDTRLVKNMPKFQLVHYTFHADDIYDMGIDDTGRFSGSKTQLEVRFELKRYLLSVFFQSYFPAMIMVGLAGLGMWIDPKSVPARVSLGVTSVLTISTIITGLKAALPKVSYLTAMDVYLWTCFIFVFSTVVEFCVVNYLMTEKGKRFLQRVQSRKETRLRNKQCTKYCKKNDNSATSNWRNVTVVSIRRKNNMKMIQSDRAITQTYNRTHCENNNNENTYIVDKDLEFNCSDTLCLPSASMDAKFRIVYFLSFILFNIVYWTYYILATQHAESNEIPLASVDGNQPRHPSDIRSPYIQPSDVV